MFSNDVAMYQGSVQIIVLGSRARRKLYHQFYVAKCFHPLHDTLMAALKFDKIDGPHPFSSREFLRDPFVGKRIFQSCRYTVSISSR